VEHLEGGGRRQSLGERRGAGGVDGVARQLEPLERGVGLEGLCDRCRARVAWAVGGFEGERERRKGRERKKGEPPLFSEFVFPDVANKRKKNEKPLRTPLSPIPLADRLTDLSEQLLASTAASAAAPSSPTPLVSRDSDCRCEFCASVSASVVAPLAVRPFLERSSASSLLL
jgi:hypothetical protein